MKRAALIVAGVLSVGIVVYTGALTIVYLGRWQWNRSIMWGFIFLSSLVILSTALVLRSIASMEARARGSDPLAPDMAVVSALREANLRRGPRFEWLQEDPNRLSVFLPVLLGAGVLLSALAYVIERISGAVAGGRLDHRTAAIVPLDLPMSGRVTATPMARRPRPRHSRASRVLGIVMVVLLGLTGVEVVRRLTMTMPGDVTGPGTTTLTVEIRTITDRSVEDIAIALWTVCAGRVSDSSRITSIVVDGDQVQLTVDQGLLTTGKRRVIGCFEDLTLDRVKARVVELESFPDPPTT